MKLWCEPGRLCIKQEGGDWPGTLLQIWSGRCLVHRRGNNKYDCWPHLPIVQVGYLSEISVWKLLVFRGPREKRTQSRASVLSYIQRFGEEEESLNRQNQNSQRRRRRARRRWCHWSRGHRRRESPTLSCCWAVCCFLVSWDRTDLWDHGGSQGTLTRSGREESLIGAFKKKKIEGRGCNTQEARQADLREVEASPVYRAKL